MGERHLVQPPGLPRFNEDSAFKKHWPLLWLSALGALIVASFVTDFNNLGRIFDNQGSSKIHFETNYIFPDGQHMLSYSRLIGGGRKEHETIDARRKEWSSSADRIANTITFNGYRGRRRHWNRQCQSAGEPCLFKVKLFAPAAWDSILL